MQELKKITKQTRKLRIINNREKFFAIANLLHIGETIQHPTFKFSPTYRLENDRRYYVDMPTMKEQQLEKNIIVNLDEGSPKDSLKET
jgi:hypothetical protein